MHLLRARSRVIPQRHYCSWLLASASLIILVELLELHIVLRMSVGLLEALAPYIAMLLLISMINLLRILSGTIFICLLSGNSRRLASQRVFRRAPESLFYGQAELHVLDILLRLHYGLFAGRAALRRGREC